MDSLLHLSAVACEAERMKNCESGPMSDSSSCCSSSSEKSTLVVPTVHIPRETIPAPPVKISSPKMKVPCDQIQPADRLAIKDRIRNSYRKKATTYDELIELCVGLSEDHIYMEAPSKLDYYKHGISFVKKIFDKSAELSTEVENKYSLEDPSCDTPKVVKRAKTQH